MGKLENLGVRPQHLGHIVVSVAHVERHGARAVFLVEEGGGLRGQLLAALKQGAVVVSQDVGEAGLFGAACHVGQMEETLPPFGVFRALRHGQQRLKFHGDQAGVKHLVFG